MTLFILQLCSSAAAAQDLRVAQFKTTSAQPELTQLSAALDPVLQAELGKLSQVSVAAVPPLDLPSMQLALDCVGETPSCLGVALERAKTDALLSPRLSRSQGARVLSLLLFDPRAAEPLQVVTRRYGDDASDSQILEGAVQLVHELFGQPLPATEPDAPAEPDAPPDQAVDEGPAEAALLPLAAAGAEAPNARPSSAERETPSLLLPIVLGAAGVAVVGVGLGFGVAAHSNQDRYAGLSIGNQDDANRADDLLSRAHTQATLSNIAVALGAASCVAAGVVFFVQRAGQRRPDSAPGLQLTLGPGWLSLTGGL